MTEVYLPQISVIIPAYGDRGHLQDIIDALEGQRKPIERVIIAHSGSGDPTGCLHSNTLPVKYMHREKQLNSGAARNRGAELAQTDWLAFLDDDVIPAPDWSETLHKTISGNPKNICFVGSIDVDVTGGYWGMCTWFLEFGSVHPYLPSRDIEGGASANMFVHRRLFERCGGFPENVTRCVDVEFMFRCKQSGGTTRFVSSAIASHRNIAGFVYNMRHALKQGRGSARVRKIAPLSGGVFSRFPVLSPVLYPARLVLMGWRVLRWGRGSRLSFGIHLPGIALLLLAWNYGFLLQAWNGQKQTCEQTSCG